MIGILKLPENNLLLYTAIENMNNQFEEVNNIYFYILLYDSEESGD